MCCNVCSLPRSVESKLPEEEMGLCLYYSNDFTVAADRSPIGIKQTTGGGAKDAGKLYSDCLAAIKRSRLRKHLEQLNGMKF